MSTIKKPLFAVKNICCLGAGYVGGPSMAVIADNCPDLQISVVDINEIQISRWNDSDLSNLPVYEPGLEEIIKKTRFRNLHFSTQIKECIAKADLIFISVNTPTKKYGTGAGHACDLRWVESSVRLVGKYSVGHTIVVEKSTVPVRTGAAIRAILDSVKKEFDKENKKSFDVLSNPEFLAEGTAVNDLQKPDRVLIGGERDESINALENIYLKWVPKNKIIRTNLWSSELSKLSANAFLAQRVSSINTISSICEATGADVSEVANSIGKDIRIGPKFLKAGPGFGGSCFKKDILSLVYLCEYYGLKEIANYWNQVVVVNNYQQERLYKIVLNKLFGTVAGKKIAILGFAYKANTNDTRESPSIFICKKLIEEGAHLSINDPKVNPKSIAKDLGIKPTKHEINSSNNSNGSWEFSEKIDESLTSADAGLILCDWDIYKKLNWLKISKLMRAPAWIFDTRNIINESIINKSIINDLNINFWKIGQG